MAKKKPLTFAVKSNSKRIGRKLITMTGQKISFAFIARRET